MDHDVSDEEKLGRLYLLLDDPDNDEVFTQWERDRINEWYSKTTVTNYDFSEKQSIKIGEIYETAYKSGCFDT